MIILNSYNNAILSMISTRVKYFS